MNRDFYLVQENVQEIIQKITDYNAKVMDIHREISINDEPKPAPAARPTQRPGYRR